MCRKLIVAHYVLKRIAIMKNAFTVHVITWVFAARLLGLRLKSACVIAGGGGGLVSGVFGRLMGSLVEGLGCRLLASLWALVAYSGCIITNMCLTDL